MTFSIVARCEDTGMLGVAIASSSPAVAARCSFAKSKTGAVATQNITNPALGPYILSLIENGSTAEQAINALEQVDEHLQYRQVLLVDSTGNSAIHSGKKALGIWSDANNHNVACGGNLLANAEIPSTMVSAFNNSSGHLGERLLQTMEAGLQAGGEAGPVHSAGLKIVDDVSWPIVDLRCDWTESCPIGQLRNTWKVYQPQISDYIDRALNPHKAPGYGVPGDP